MVNVLGCWDDQCTKYATLTISVEKLRKHGKGVCAPIISRLNERGFNDPGMRGVQKKRIKTVHIKLSLHHIVASYIVKLISNHHIIVKSGLTSYFCIIIFFLYYILI
jgi:hypothetical protein